MKRFLKTIVCIVMLAVSLLCITACDESRDLRSVNFSISDEYATVSSSGRIYTLYMTNEKVPILVRSDPSGFSATDFSWTTSASDVAYITNDGYLVTTGEGRATLYARYTNTNGEIINQAFTIYVAKTVLPHFKYDTYTATYTASNLANEDFCKIEGNSSDHAYSYFYISNEGIKKTDVIKDCGEYQIKCHLSGDENAIVDEMTLIVEKATINVLATNCYSVYGEDTSSSERENVFYYAGSLDREYDHKIISTLGADAGEEIGEYCYTTTASVYSQVGSSYQTSVDFRLYDTFAKNYKVAKTSGRHIISKREVLVVLNDRTLSYGATLPVNNFRVFDYDEDYESIDYSLLNELDKAYYISTGDIVTNEYSFYDKSGVKLGEDASLLDVSADEYSVTYNSIKSKGNLLIKAVVAGNVCIEKREIVVSIINPTSNFGKTYGEEDDLSSLTFDLGENATFERYFDLNSLVYINYKSESYGAKNVKAPVGSYYYGITNNQNNFDFSLAPSCVEGYAGGEIVNFCVKSLPIDISFESEEVEYKVTSNDVAINYFTQNDIENDYDVEISSLQINGERIIHEGEFLQNNGICAKDENFATNGLFVLNSTGDRFGFRLTINDDTTSAKYYKRYKISLDFSETNSNLQLNTSDFYLSVEKIMIPISPLETGSSAVYSSGLQPTSLADYVRGATTSSSVVLSDVIIDGSQIFTLTDEDGNYHTESEIISASKMDWSVGRYKIFISPTLSYKTGQDYYGFYLDKDYYFEITKLGIIVTPKSISKVYGNDDEVITYDITLESGAGIFLTNAEGALSRKAGENVGEYLINAGNLSFGKNYNVIFSNEDEVCYSITPRTLIIKPHNADITYGETFPVSSASSGNFDIEVEGEGSYNKNILVLPNKNTEFEGNFYLSKTGSESNLEEKINGYYKAGTYYIVLGEGTLDGFRYVGFLDNSSNRVRNYEIKLKLESSKPTSTCLIRPKTAYIDFISQSVDTLPYAEPGTLNLNSEDNANILSSSSLLAGDVLYLDCDYSVTPNALVYVEDISKISNIIIKRNGIDVTNCYNTFVLRNSVLYEKDTEIINMFISPIANNAYTINGNLLTARFDGESKKDCFEITFTSSTGNVYALSDACEASLTANTDLSKGMVFTKNAVAVDAINAGSYVVSFALSDDLQIILNKLTPGTNEKDTSIEFSFSAFNTISNNCYLQLKQNAYLTITKADINVDSSLVSFDDSTFVYGQSEKDLPRLLTSGGIFTDINGKDIELLDYDGLNFEYISSSEALENLVNGYHLISVSITKAIAGEEDSNYNSKIIDVMLNVSPREIKFDNLSFGFKRNGVDVDISSAIVYDGNTVSCVLSPSSVAYVSNIEFDSQDEDPTLYELGGKYYFRANEYNIVYEIYPLEFVFEDDSCLVKKYTWDSTLGEVGEYEQDMPIPSGISSLVVQGGYVVVNNSYCFKISDATPQMQNSGIYVCMPVITPKNDNYIVNATQSFNIIGIGRLKDGFELNYQNSEFYQGTIINPNRSQEIIELFGLTMSPNLVDKLTFAGANDWINSNYALPVGSYKLSVSLNNPEDETIRNYYFAASIDFDILMRKAEINFPASTDWAYSGEKIEAFLPFISVTLYDVGGTKQIKFYNSVESYFTIEVYDEGGSLLDEYPFDVGIYYLHAKYRDETYESEGDYSSWEYHIVPSQYTGTINFADPKFPYDPNISYEVFYNKLVDQITVGGYKITTAEARDIVSSFVLYISNSEIEDDEAAANVMCILPSEEMTEAEKARVIKEVMGKVDDFYFTCKIIFAIPTISNTFKSVKTEIVKSVIYEYEFSLKAEDSMYNGDYQFCGLMWGPIDLSPFYGKTQKGNIPANSSEHPFESKQSLGPSIYTLQTYKKADDYVVTLLDNFHNKVFSVTYTYTFAGYSMNPIQPRTYNLSYTISFSNGMYKSSPGWIPEKKETTFDIIAPKKIKVECSNPENSTYSGSDLKTSVFDTVSISASVESDSGTTIVENVHYSCLASGKNAAYDETFGVMLYYEFYSVENGVYTQVNEVKNAGNYALRIGYCDCMNILYWVTDKDIVFVLNNSERTGNCIDLPFSIAKKSLNEEVTTESFKEAFFSTGDIQENTIIISKDTTILIDSQYTIGEKTAFVISRDYAIIVYANNAGIQTSLIEDFNTAFFTSDSFGSADMANIYVYKISDLNNYYSTSAIKVKFS